MWKYSRCMICKSKDNLISIAPGGYDDVLCNRCYTKEKVERGNEMKNIFNYPRCKTEYTPRDTNLFNLGDRLDRFFAEHRNEIGFHINQRYCNKFYFDLEDLLYDVRIYMPKNSNILARLEDLTDDQNRLLEKTKAKYKEIHDSYMPMTDHRHLAYQEGFCEGFNEAKRKYDKTSFNLEDEINLGIIKYLEEAEQQKELRKLNYDIGYNDGVKAQKDVESEKYKELRTLLKEFIKG